jgi:hypothetical protein
MCEQLLHGGVMNTRLAYRYRPKAAFKYWGSGNPNRSMPAMLSRIERSKRAGRSVGIAVL